MDGIFASLERAQQQQQQQGMQGVGRVPGVGGGTGPAAPFQMFAERTGGSSGASSGASSIARVWDGAEVAPSTRLFMSEANVRAVQEAIRYRVYVESGGKYTIGYQSADELAIVMRSVLLQHGRNLGAGNGAELAAEVRALNERVLAYCVQRVLGEVRQYVRYREDISTMPAPMAPPTTVSTKGDRSLQMSKTFL